MITKIPFDTSIKTQWDDITKTNHLTAPFFQFTWQEAWNKTIAGDWHPYPLLINDTVIAPFARKENEVIFSGGEEISDYQDILGPEELKTDAWKEVMPFLKKEGISSITLRNIPQDSPTVSFFQSFSDASIQQEDTTPKIAITGSWEQHVESLPHKARHELERKLRKFDREHPDHEIVESGHPAADMDIFFQLMEKDEAKRAFLTPTMKEFFQEVTKQFSDSVSLLLLRMGDKTAAATVSFVWNGSYLLYNSGFDKACCPNSGFYLKAVSVKRAFEKGCKEYNFLQGNERYKYELGGKDFFVYSVSASL